jgi:hypothetical protein
LVPTLGLASPARARRGERAPEAGSQAAKPRDRWRASAGFASERAHGSTCRWKALRAGEIASLDGGATEAVLGASGSSGSGPGGSGRDRERQRRFPPTARKADKACVRGLCFPAEPGVALARNGEGGAVSGRADAGRAASIARSLGVGLRKRGPAPFGMCPFVGTSGPGDGRVRDGRRGVSPRARESGDLSGAQVATSVAEVGEKHLLRGLEGSRETNQEREK